VAPRGVGVDQSSSRCPRSLRARPCGTWSGSSRTLVRSRCSRWCSWSTGPEGLAAGASTGATGSPDVAEGPGGATGTRTTCGAVLMIESAGAAMGPAAGGDSTALALGRAGPTHPSTVAAVTPTANTRPAIPAAGARPRRGEEPLLDLGTVMMVSSESCVTSAWKLAVGRTLEVDEKTPRWPNHLTGQVSTTHWRVVAGGGHADTDCVLSSPSRWHTSALHAPGMDSP
jgi:hypothetical protein